MNYDILNKNIVNHHYNSKYMTSLCIAVKLQDENPVLYKYRALDLIRWIKEEYNDYFTIACSGKS